MFGRQRKDAQSIELVREQLSTADVHARTVLTNAITLMEQRLSRDLEQRETLQSSIQADIQSVQHSISDGAKDLAQALEQVANMCALVAQQIETDRLERRALIEAVNRLAGGPANALDAPTTLIGGTVFASSPTPTPAPAPLASAPAPPPVAPQTPVATPVATPMVTPLAPQTPLAPPLTPQTPLAPPPAPRLAPLPAPPLAAPPLAPPPAPPLARPPLAPIRAFLVEDEESEETYEQDRAEVRPEIWPEIRREVKIEADANAEYDIADEEDLSFVGAGRKPSFLDFDDDVITLSEYEAEAEAEEATEPVLVAATTGTMYCRDGNKWIGGVEIAEASSDNGTARFRVRRKADGFIFPNQFEASDLHFLPDTDPSPGADATTPDPSLPRFEITPIDLSPVESSTAESRPHERWQEPPRG